MSERDEGGPICNNKKERKTETSQQSVSVLKSEQSSAGNKILSAVRNWVTRIAENMPDSSSFTCNTDTIASSLRNINNRAAAPLKKANINSNSKKSIPGEAELLQWIEQAEYEVNVDPYRGIQVLVAGAKQQQQAAAAAAVKNGRFVEDLTIDDDTSAATTALAGPWRTQCSFGYADATTTTTATAATMKSSNLTPDNDNDDDDVVEIHHPELDASEQLVRATCRSSCPTLRQWTAKVIQQEQQKMKRTAGGKKNKRKRTANDPDEVTTTTTSYWGRRFESAGNRCACDYNPFCLGTLGGAMDDILQGWSQQHQQHRGDDEDDVVVLLDGKPEHADTTVWNWNDFSSACYSPVTSVQLNKVRKCKWVDEQAVRSYLQDIFQNGLTTEHAKMSLDEGMNCVRQLHQSLIFENPLVVLATTEAAVTAAAVAAAANTFHVDEDRRLMQLSIPPGIENLGATCYLNTQLQCLAQNRVFVQGIMSWRPPTNGSVGDRMSSVLALFQDLLARMNAGFGSTLNTIEFSNALGLDHYEQQDPNEFSRLLFERMHESFQQSSNGGNLAELLPHLFQGIMMYETTCLTCQAKSRRTEEFMDLNLPIVHPKPNKTGQQSIMEAFGTKLDTDVQFCLGKYCKEETLDGDNQYLCGHCGCKRDAKRALTFQKLPPVLNVQISRYVFDREKFVKKKLSDKVLLPLDLKVEATSKERKTEIVEHRYILCAVMRHKGNSAYSGHYVAEAMDWLTGQWFEFNDDKVVLLEDGPTCSYDPDAVDQEEPAPTANGVKRRNANVLSGSQDAYNMYYVEECFLAKSALDGLRKGAGPNAAAESAESVSVVDKIAMERSQFYADLSNMCIDDGNAAKRLERRRDIIRSQMFPNLSTCQLTNPDDLVWVESTPLLQFMSCRDRLRERLEQSDRAVLQHHDLLCSHETPGLHPRVARKGKLLPKLAYEAYIAALRVEKRDILGRDTDENSFNDCLILPTDNLICQDCAQEYRSELSQKLKRVLAMKYIYDSLDPKENKFTLERGLGEAWGNESDRYAYIVSRKFVTWFRNKVVRFMKRAGSAEATCVECESQFIALSAENEAEGLDGLDLSEFSVSKDEKTGIEPDDVGVAVRVNGPITCSHGNFDAVSSKSFLYVPLSTWRKINELFPKAIEHKRKRRGISHDFSDDSDEDDIDFGCMECRSEGIAEISARTNLADLAKYCQESRTCEALTNDIVLEMPKSRHCAPYRLLHKDDILAWQKFLAAFKRKDEKKRTVSPEEVTKAALLPFTTEHSPRCSLLDRADDKLSSSDRKRLELLSTVFRPIVCQAHGRPIHHALFGDVDDRKDGEPLSLNENICILDENSYKDFLAYIVAVAAMLFPSVENMGSNGSTVHAYISEAARFCEEWHLDSVSHPSFAPIRQRTGDKRDMDRFSISNDRMSMLFQLEKASCNDEVCCLNYTSWQTAETIKREEAATKLLPKSTGVADDPRAVDSDPDDGLTPANFALRVFDVKADSDLDSALASLSTCAGLPSSEEGDENQFVRRSSRKRKSRYPVGVVQEEETIQADLNNNIAVLRLLLHERCTKGTLFELDHSLKLVLHSDPKNGELIALDIDYGKETITPSLAQPSPNVQVVDLTFDLSSETMRDLCEGALGEKLGKSFRPAESIMLIRQAIEDSSATAIPKDALMDHFIGLGNTTSEVSVVGTAASNKAGRTKKARTERGFSGTFLSSTAPPMSAPAATNEESGPATTEDAASVNVGRSRLSLNASKDFEPLVSNVVKDQPPASYVDRRKPAPSHDRKLPLGVNKAQEADCFVAGISQVETTELGTAKQAALARDTKPAAVNAPVASNTNCVSQSTSSKYFSGSKQKAATTNGEEISSAASRRRQNASKPNSRDIFDDDSDIDIEILLSRPAIRKASGKTQRLGHSDRISVLVEASREHDDDTGRTTPRQSTEDRELASEIVSMLLSSPDIPQEDEQMCQMAAENAIQMHPELKDANKLVDPAYSLYLELSIP